MFDLRLLLSVRAYGFFRTVPTQGTSGTSDTSTEIIQLDSKQALSKDLLGSKQAQIRPELLQLFPVLLTDYPRMLPLVLISSQFEAAVFFPEVV